MNLVHLRRDADSLLGVIERFQKRIEQENKATVVLYRRRALAVQRLKDNPRLEVVEELREIYAEFERYLGEAESDLAKLDEVLLRFEALVSERANLKHFFWGKVNGGGKNSSASQIVLLRLAVRRIRKFQTSLKASFTSVKEHIEEERNLLKKMDGSFYHYAIESFIYEYEQENALTRAFYESSSFENVQNVRNRVEAEFKKLNAQDAFLVTGIQLVPFAGIGASAGLCFGVYMGFMLWVLGIVVKYLLMGLVVVNASRRGNDVSKGRRGTFAVVDTVARWRKSRRAA